MNNLKEFLALLGAVPFTSAIIIHDISLLITAPSLQIPSATILTPEAKMILQLWNSWVLLAQII